MLTNKLIHLAITYMKQFTLLQQ